MNEEVVNLLLSYLEVDSIFKSHFHLLCESIETPTVKLHINEAVARMRHHAEDDADAVRTQPPVLGICFKNDPLPQPAQLCLLIPDSRHNWQLLATGRN
jgi:hypothetical protein